jgi:hypothetical protein
LVGDKATIERLSVQGPNGVLSASGSADIKSRRMSFSVLSSGIPLQRVTPDLKGTLALSAKVGGTFDQPSMKGRAEIFSAAFQDRQIPAVLADLSLANNRLIASNVQAIADGVQANGFLAYNIKSDRVDGRMQARLFLRDLLGEAAAGVADVEVRDIDGTLSSPTAVASVDVGKSFFGGVEVDSAKGTARIAKSGVALTDFRAQVGEGTVAGTGRYHFDTKSGSFTGSALAIPIERLSVQIADRAKLEGLVDVNQVRALIDPTGLRSLTAGGVVRNLEINDTIFDGGPWSVSGTDHLWKGSAMLGVLERYVQISQFSYDSKSKVLDADLSALDLDIQPLVGMVKPYLQPPQPGQTLKPVAQLSPDAMRKVESLKGLVSAALSVHGPLDHLTISEGLVDARNLSVLDKVAGNLNTTFTKANDRWDISKLNFAGPLGNLDVAGMIEENGQVNLDGEINNLDVNWLSVFDPDLASVTGKVNVSFLVAGPTKRPDVTGTLDARLIEEEKEVLVNSLSPTKVKEPTLSMNGPFALRNVGDDAYTLTTDGLINYRVFKGSYAAEAALDSPFSLSETKPWTASIVAAAREVTQQELESFLPSLDPLRTHLKASGELKAQGTGKDFNVSGVVALWKNETTPATEPAVAVKGLDTALMTLDANARLNEGALAVTIGADSSQGGNVQGNVSLGLGNVEELLSALVSGNSEPLFGRPLSGSVAFSNFGVRERQIFEEAEGEKGFALATLNGTVLVGKSLGTPLFSVPENQPLLVSSGDFILPTLDVTEAGSTLLRVVPEFNLSVQFAEPAKLRAGNTSLTVIGGGTIGGNLALPAIDARFDVQEGLVRLPTARVRIEEGGSLHLQYRAQPEGDPISRLDVNLQGNTSLTALRFGNVVERYNVYLEMTGDLLSDVPINIRATSDPGDLSQDQILRLIGQADVLEGLTASVKASIGDPGVRTAIGTFAVPALFDPLTERLATNLGLDYLSVEYNALEQATITAGKTLGKGLTLQYRRQLFEPLNGEKQRFDLRLTYRLPTRNPLLSRVTFSIGMDQDRPYKLSLEYGTRF